jgi:tubulin polyglutamylase TTLL4
VPGSETLCHKVEFWRHFQRYQKKFGEAEFGWHLPAFVLPEELEQFKDQFTPGDMWIYKPSTTCRLEGIEIFRSVESIPLRPEAAVAQLFLPDPFLVADGKVEPRISVLVTSIHPLRVYVYDDGLVKIFSNYQQKMEENLKGNIFLANMKGEERSSLSEFFTHMSRQGHPVQKIKEQLYDIIIKALIMGESKMSSEGKKWLPARGTAYQYYSADFMFDKELKPYLIEMNRFPAYWLAGQYEYYRRHLIDMLNLVGYKVPVVLNGLQKEEEVQETLGKEYAHGGIVKEFDTIKLTSEDLLDLMDGEDELHRMIGTGFARIFPTSQTSK